MNKKNSLIELKIELEKCIFRLQNVENYQQYSALYKQKEELETMINRVEDKTYLKKDKTLKKSKKI